MEERKPIRPKHNITIEDREKMIISGVKDVNNFDENNIILSTEMGGLTIKGNNMHINKLNVEDGNLFIEGFFISWTYTEKSESKRQGGFFSNLFK